MIWAWRLITAGATAHSTMAVGGAIIAGFLIVVAAMGTALWTHDNRISSTATAACVAKADLEKAENALKLAEAEKSAFREDVATLARAMETREKEFKVSTNRIASLEKDLDDARKTTPNGDAVIVDDNDPWLLKRTATSRDRAARHRSRANTVPNAIPGVSIGVGASSSGAAGAANKGGSLGAH